jgi:hypothetical protein
MKESKKVIRRLIDPETGETVCMYEGDRILRNSSLEHLSDVEKLEIKHFLQGNVDELIYVLPTLEINEKAILLSVIPYVGYHDCCLKFKNGKNLNTDNIIAISTLSLKTGYSIVNNLIKKNIFYKGKNSKGRQYFVNPWLFNRGVTTNKVLKTMFENYIIRSKDNTKWKDLV